MVTLRENYVTGNAPCVKCFSFAPSPLFQPYTMCPAHTNVDYIDVKFISFRIRE